ncbi:MAG: diguanylate cyclase [Thermodesulfovibrio sp.]|nr:diguanylate cyclase [Thermodesulfovibrio sp.]
MHRKEIALLLDSNMLRPFLEKFFKKRREYCPSYFSDSKFFLNHVRESNPAAVIISGAALKNAAEAVRDYPSLALVGEDARRGILEAIKYQIKSYLLPPYLDVDLAHKLEAVIKESELLVKMEFRRKELEAVVELTQLISDTLDSKELLFRVVRKIAEIIPVTRCSIIKIDWRHKTAFVVASFEDPMFRGVKLSLRKYPEILEALTSKKHVVVRDVATDPIMEKVRELITPIGIRSILVVPIFYRSKVIGTLFLRTSRAQHTFSEHEISLLNSMAHASANSLYNAFLFEQVEDEKTRLEKLAITDYLTGIYNIRYFYHRIVQEFSRSQRYAAPLSCLMLDIDHFKKINDIYGHKVGDQVLREFATVLKKHSRKSDVLARYGGEEFILLLPETAPEGAGAEAERIRACIREHRFKSLKGSRTITVSVGIATYPDPRIKTYDDLISCADTALFTAKNSGRNQVAAYTG